MNYEDWRTRLNAGETITRKVHGNSMTPRIQSGQEVTISPVPKATPEHIKEGDVVFCKVRGNYYVHLVKKIRRGDRPGDWLFLIGNNHGHTNGWTRLVFGVVK